MKWHKEEIGNRQLEVVQQAEIITVNHLLQHGRQYRRNLNHRVVKRSMLKNSCKKFLSHKLPQV